MHRFSLCKDLLKEESLYQNGNLALLVILLRFSSLRLLTWQRNHNTKPRELGYNNEYIININRIFSKLINKVNYIAN